MPLPDIARNLGLSINKTSHILTKLEERDVPSRRPISEEGGGPFLKRGGTFSEKFTHAEYDKWGVPFGALFSRRMVRDEYISQIRSSNGTLGGNPNLVNQSTTSRQPKAKLTSKQKPTPSSSPSSSTSPNTDKFPSPDGSGQSETPVFSLPEAGKHRAGNGHGNGTSVLPPPVPKVTPFVSRKQTALLTREGWRDRPETTPRIDALWARLLSDLDLCFDRHRFETWVKPTLLVSDSPWQFWVPNQYFVEWWNEPEFNTIIRNVLEIDPNTTIEFGDCYSLKTVGNEKEH